jgi:hypothetical protein
VKALAVEIGKALDALAIGPADPARAEGARWQDLVDRGKTFANFLRARVAVIERRVARLENLDDAAPSVAGCVLAVAE